MNAPNAYICVRNACNKYVIMHICLRMLTCMGNQSNANAATTTNTNLVTRFRPRPLDSFVRLCGTTVRHKRNINAYKPLISVNGIKYELEKNIM